MTAPDVFFSPTPDRVIAEMLRLANITQADVVYDLGCGDGRIVVAAARDRGATGIGLDVDPALLELARNNARTAGVENLVRFELADIFAADLSAASVIALYLIDSLNVRLRPRILAQCAPGTRVVTYSFEMGNWECDAHTPIAANGVSLWLVPANLSGVWEVQGSPQGSPVRRLMLEQRFQRVSGKLEGTGGSAAGITGVIAGDRVSLDFVSNEGGRVSYIGTIKDESLVVTSERGDSISATRVAGTRMPLE